MLKDSPVSYVPTPAMASDTLVLNQAKNVRSEARWSLATLPVFFKTKLMDHHLGSFVGPFLSGSASWFVGPSMIEGVRVPGASSRPGNIRRLAEDRRDGVRTAD